MNNPIAKFEDMPCTVHGYMKTDSDGYHTIILNARDSAERQLRAYRHEIEHIEDGDCSDTRPADLIEISAHK